MWPLCREIKPTGTNRLPDGLSRSEIAISDELKMRVGRAGFMNHLYYGDNLLVLCEHIADESIHLIYLDPLFKSKRDYDLLSLGLSLKDVRTSNVSE
jgi:hypothetical protein